MNIMKTLLTLSLISLSLIACSSVEIKNYDSEEDARYQKYKDETVNMSEYDKQRYYNQHHLGVVEPDRVRESIREQRRKQSQ